MDGAIIIVAIACIAVAVYVSANKKTQGAQQNNAESLCALGGIAKAKGNNAEAAGYFRQAAERGHALSQALLGEMLFHGIGVAVNYAEALMWCLKSAEQGNSLGLVHLGNMYEYGYAVQEDATQAAELYRSAAAQGNYFAHHKLGWLYLQGKGVPKDLVQAYLYIAQAVSLGFREASQDLDLVASGMSPSQLTEAKQLSAGWLRSNK